MQTLAWATGRKHVQLWRPAEDRRSATHRVAVPRQLHRCIDYEPLCPCSTLSSHASISCASHCSDSSCNASVAHLRGPSRGGRTPPSEACPGTICVCSPFEKAMQAMQNPQKSQGAKLRANSLRVLPPARHISHHRQSATAKARRWALLGRARAIVIGGSPYESCRLPGQPAVQVGSMGSGRGRAGGEASERFTGVETGSHTNARRSTSSHATLSWHAGAR